MKKNNRIFIVAQQFYGNRTGTEINREDINFFLKGILSPKLFPGEEKTVERRIVRVPNTDNTQLNTKNTLVEISQCKCPVGFLNLILKSILAVLLAGLMKMVNCIV